jgi:hypothetical protein
VQVINEECFPALSNCYFAYDFVSTAWQSRYSPFGSMFVVSDEVGRTYKCKEITSPNLDKPPVGKIQTHHTMLTFSRLFGLHEKSRIAWLLSFNLEKLCTFFFFFFFLKEEYWVSSSILLVFIWKYINVIKNYIYFLLNDMYAIFKFFLLHLYHSKWTLEEPLKKFEENDKNTTNTPPQDTLERPTCMSSTPMHLWEWFMYVQSVLYNYLTTKTHGVRLTHMWVSLKWFDSCTTSSQLTWGKTHSHVGLT